MTAKVIKMSEGIDRIRLEELDDHFDFLSKFIIHASAELDKARKLLDENEEERKQIMERLGNGD